jgi:hypothetical protein
MAYKKDFDSGYKYCMKRGNGFFKQLGITDDYRFAAVYSPANIKNLMKLTDAFLRIKNYDISNPIVPLVKKKQENLINIYSVQTSKSVLVKRSDNIPSCLASFGHDWHWWSESEDLKAFVTISDIIGITVEGYCLQIFDDDCMDALFAYISIFHDDFCANKYPFAYLKNLLDDLSYITSVKGLLNNRHLLSKSLKISDFQSDNLHCAFSDKFAEETITV